jgi:hypothetical protein
MTADKPICSLSLDLDNEWTYMKSHGDPGWENFPSYLDLVVPRFLKVLGKFGWRITVFVVGQDAALERNHEALQKIVGAGHEIGNHSFNHDTWLHLYSTQEIGDEIIRAEEAIEGATGRRPRGFRGPGYSLSRETLEVLAKRNYLYDASTLPTFLGPLARAYLFFKSGLRNYEKNKRKKLFGNLRDGLRPIRPYLWELGNDTLLEIPVTTMPIFRLPIHFSYLLYISTFSPQLAQIYFKAALRLCRFAGVEPSLLLHPLDFLGNDDVSSLGFFPAMNCSKSEKKTWLAQSLQAVCDSHTVTPLEHFATQTCGRSSHRDPRSVREGLQIRKYGSNV